MKKLAVLFLAAGIAAGLLGCSKSSPTSTTNTVHDTTYVAQAKYIYSLISRYYAGGPPTRYATNEIVWIFSDPAPNHAQSSAKLLRGSTLYNIKGEMQGPGSVLFRDTFPYPYSDVDSLVVNTNLGSGRSGNVTLPGAYTLTAPRSGDTLAWGDLAVTWTSAQYANWYDLYVWYDAYNGANWLGSADTEIILSGTSALVPQAYFRKYSPATYVRASVSVEAVNGPRVGPGESGNITGEFKGVFLGFYSDSADYASIYMGSPKLPLGSSPPLPPRISEEKRREKLLQAFKEQFKIKAD